MEGWILYKRKQSELIADDHGVLRLCEAAERESIVLKVYRPEQFDVCVETPARAGIFIDGELHAPPDFLLPRMGAESSYAALAVMRQLELHGVLVCNSSRAIIHVKDKLHMSQQFSAAGLPTPKTLLVKFPCPTDLVVRELGLPVVVKIISGARGVGVYLCETEASFADLMALLSVQTNSPGFIVQEFIRSSFGEDLRVFVVGNEVIGCMKRKASHGFKANYSLGGTVDAYAVTPQIRDLALAASQLFGLEIAGIDLLFQPPGFSICEANSSPGFKGMEQALGIDIAAKIIAYVKNKVLLHHA